jgi:arylsulfatase
MEDGTMPAEGTLTLHVNDKPVGEERIRTQAGKFSLAGEGLNIGRDGGEPVTDDYPGDSPWAFVGGEVERVIIDVSGEPFVDLAKEAEAMFARE